MTPKEIKTAYEQCARVALTGTTVGPNIYKVMEILGREETIKRLKAFMTTTKPTMEDAMTQRIAG